MNRNVVIVVIILIVVVILGYFVWLRNKYQPPVSPEPTKVENIPMPENPKQNIQFESTQTAEEATGTPKQKTASPSASPKR